MSKVIVGTLIGSGVLCTPNKYEELSLIGEFCGQISGCGMPGAMEAKLKKDQKKASWEIKESNQVLDSQVNFLPLIKETSCEREDNVIVVKSEVALYDMQMYLSVTCRDLSGPRVETFFPFEGKRKRLGSQ